MYYRILGAACAAFLTCVSVAQAADPKIVVLNDGSPSVQRRVTLAAAQLCAKAIATDPDDYGSEAECITDSLANVHTIYTTAQTVADAK